MSAKLVAVVLGVLALLLEHLRNRSNVDHDLRLRDIEVRVAKLECKP